MTDRPTIEQCRVWLDIYGTRLSDWPATQRAQATAAFADPEYGALWDEAVALDATLDEWSVEPPSPALVARVEASAPRRARRPLIWPLLAAAAALSGAAIGSVAAAAITPPTQHIDEPTNTAFGSLDEGIQ